MVPHPNFETQKHYQNEPKLNCVYWRKKLLKTNDGAYIINLDDDQSIWIYCIALHVNAENVTFFDSFGVERIPKEIKNSLKMKISQQIFIEY